MKGRLASIGLAAITALSCTPQDGDNKQPEGEVQNPTAALLSTCQATNEKLLGVIKGNEELAKEEKALIAERQEIYLKSQAMMLGITAKIASDANRVCAGDFFMFQTMKGITENFGSKGRNSGFIAYQDMTIKDDECIRKVIAVENTGLQKELPNCEVKMQTRNGQSGIAVECMY